MTDLGTISSAALDQYLVSARAVGLDTVAGLHHARIDERLLGDPMARIDSNLFENLLDWFIHESGDPLFGLHTSQFVQPGSYSVMGYIAMSATSLLEALSRVTLYEKLVGDMGVTETVALPDGRLCVRWLCRHQRQPVRRHLIENVLGSWVRYARWLINDTSINPAEVWFEHAGPANLSALRDYHQVFGCDVLFNQPYNALLADQSLLTHRLRQPDPLLFATLEAHAAQALHELNLTGNTLAQRVQLRIRALIENDLPRKEKVAADLGMTERTLHRRLQDEGTTWQTLVDQVRDELAKNMLRNSDLTQAAIAERLGYADTRSFQRAFKRRCGSTPGEWRDQQRR